MPIIKATNGSEYQTGTWAEEVIGKNETSKTADNSVTQYWLSKEWTDGDSMLPMKYRMRPGSISVNP